MNKIFLFFILLFFLFCSVSSAVEKLPEINPAAYFPETKFEFTQVVAGTYLTHDFTVFNKGKSPLFIEKVKAG